FALPLGNLLVTGGVGENQGMAVWAHQAAPDTRGPAVGFHIPRAGQANYPLGSPITLLIHETLATPTIVNGTSFIVRPVGGSAVAGRLTFSFDDVLTFTPNAPLAANTTYEVVLAAGGIRDAAGNGMVGYSFSFSTGATVNGNTPPAFASFDASPYPAAPGGSVTFGAAASDPQGEVVDYRFDFGDGAPKTAWGTPNANHVFAAAGHYRATVQARDPHGAISSRTRVITVATPPPGALPASSTSALCDVPARRIWTVNPDHGTVAAVDADSGSLELETPVCLHPRALARAAAGEIWVACGGDDRIRILDASGSPVGEIPLGYGSAPAGIVASPNGATLYVALEGRGELRRLDAASRQTTATLALGPAPRALALSADGTRLLVTRFLSDRDWGEVWDVATAGLTLTRTIRLPKLGGDAHRDGTAEGRGTPNQLVGIAIAPDGSSAWVTATKPNVDRGTLFGPDLDSDNTVRATLVELALGPGTAVRAIDLDNSDSPSAIAFSPLGDYLFVTLQGGDELMVLDAFETGSAAGLGSLVTRLGTGAAPQGLCVDAPNDRVFVQNFLGRSTSIFEAGEFYASGDIQVPSTVVDSAGTVAGEPLAANVLAGKRIFYHGRDPRMSAEGYLSCATCHLDGRDDGRVWDFSGRGEGLRRTVPLRGRAGMEQGNVHWSANFDEIQDFEGDIRNAFGGAGFMEDDDFTATAAPLGPAKAGLSPDLDRLAAYVASLGPLSVPRSPFRNADGSVTTAGVAGRARFRTLGCTGCHRGAGFSDSTLGGATLHDVGTLRTTSGGRLGEPLTGIDTPTLVGLWTQSRFLHDGSAATLDSVFTVAGGSVLAAEDAIPSAGAQIVSSYVDLNNDDTVHGRAYAALGPNGASITYSGVDGGGGGVGAIELRYSSTGASQVSISVNGVAQNLNLAAVGNNPTWRHTNWRSARLEGVAFSAGASNTVQITGTSAFPNLSLDEITVSRPDELTRAFAHRSAGTLPPALRAELVAYLLQLDATPEDNPGSAIFLDGFGSAGT
ncbi:MAG: Ig-like domain-containing protein, partial [Thermoanaerobaculia bacterium]